MEAFSCKAAFYHPVASGHAAGMLTSRNIFRRHTGEVWTLDMLCAKCFYVHPSTQLLCMVGWGSSRAPQQKTSRLRRGDLWLGKNIERELSLLGWRWYYVFVNIAKTYRWYVLVLCLADWLLDWRREAGSSSRRHSERQWVYKPPEQDVHSHNYPSKCCGFYRSSPSPHLPDVQTPSSPSCALFCTISFL